MCFGQNEIVFSHPSGFYDWNFVLDLHAENGDTLRYTLDGSVPTHGSAICEGRLPMTILNYLRDSLMFIQTSPGKSQPQTDNFKANILRVACFNGATRTSKVYNQTYFVGTKKEERYPGFPVISILTDANNFFHNDTGIYVPGINFKGPNSGNYFKKGKEWERSAHIQFFNPDGTLGFGQDVGIRIQGRNRTPQKSLRICAREVYGENQINFSVFPDRQNTVFRKLVLRNSLGCWQKTLFKDQLTSFICKDLDFEVMASRPCIIFLDGEYWGIHAIREYFNDDHIAQTFGAVKDSVNIAAHSYGARSGAVSSKNLEEGNAASLVEMYAYIKSNDLAIDKQYYSLNRWLDISSVIDYYCAEIFFNNRDWPSNNNVMWSIGEKGQWRQGFLDLDAGWMYAETNTLKSLITKPENRPIPYANLLIYELMQSPIFKREFAKRMACLLQNEFTSENLLSAINRYEKMYEPLMLHHTKRWGSPGTVSQWKSKVNLLRSFAKQRPDQIKTDFSEMFGSDFNPDSPKCK